MNKLNVDWRYLKISPRKVGVSSDVKKSAYETKSFWRETPNFIGRNFQTNQHSLKKNFQKN